ncbi:hypothetical protein [Paraburkholderia sp. ZP32-5]|uniref:hypothetical protein n=1 Tax=Paraburkholderia sp. ZP32-5 TaxID=2883245 RepID=UPI001F4807ED|nr:hypothetical protein [Paraburkholderia sp. ZP32-5]
MPPHEFFRLFAAIAVGLFAIATSTHGLAEEKPVTVPFPQGHIDAHASILYCDSVADTELMAASPDSAYVQSPAGPAALSAVARRGTDRVVVELEKQQLYTFPRRDFESGSASKEFPMQIIDNAGENLVARADDPVDARGVTVFTLDRERGLGTWTIVDSKYPMLNGPRVESMYVLFGAHKN